MYEDVDFLHSTEFHVFFTIFRRNNILYSMLLKHITLQ